MIREANLEDIPKLLILGKRFFKASEYSEISEFSEDASTETLKHLINSDDGILLVTDSLKGVVGGLLYPFYMTGEKTGQELFWWCEEKGEGLKLLDALEDMAKEKGAKSFTMLSLENLSPERLDKIYLEKGYRRSEHTYIRSL